MTAYGQADLTGTEITWFHVDRTVCDDDGCMCELPTSEQVKARKRASRRGDWYVSVPGRDGIQGPLSERLMREKADAYLAAGQSPIVLKVVEDYGP